MRISTKRYGEQSDSPRAIIRLDITDVHGITNSFFFLISFLAAVDILGHVPCIRGHISIFTHQDIKTNIETGMKIVCIAVLKRRDRFRGSTLFFSLRSVCT